MPSNDEILCAVQNLSKDSAPGPDGFTGNFYQTCWPIIGQDVINAIQLFFSGFGLPKALSSATLILIPKIKNPTSLDQVRPISLCNFFHKIISRILNDRVRPLLSKLISSEQFGFMPGRSIHQCIALAHDLTADINKKVHGGNVIAKLDMSKAYDRLSWIFLVRAMKAFGFSDAWCDLIYRNISNCWYSIRMRGKSFGFFKSNRGLRQGDPLSPSLFIIAMEILSRNLNRAARPGGGIMPYWTKIRALEINHLLYADDILVFSNGGKKSFSSFLDVVGSFCVNSGQVLQPSKCRLFFSKYISVGRQRELLRISGYTSGSFPIQYLGAPLFTGPPRLVYFQRMVDIIKDKVAGWMKSFLSMAGRITLIKSVLASIPIHTLAALPVPKGVLLSIEKLFRGFLWGCGENKRRHWVNWYTICSNRQSGGLGIGSLGQTMSALKGKMAWNYLSNNSLWAQHARSRFVLGRRGSYIWQSVSPFISSIASDCHWVIGDGSTNTKVFLSNIALPCPKRLKDKSIKEVLTSINLRRELLHNVNPRILGSIKDVFVEHKVDKLVWEKDPSGVVSMKALLALLRPVEVPVRKFEVIWQPWIPLKISVFLWKLLHSALATNDNVMRVGITLVSKCVCCTQAAVESMEHLFIDSDMASLLWNSVCPIFGKRKPSCISHVFYDWGVEANFKNFSDCLAFGLVSACLWEIWKSRNCIVYGESVSRLGRGDIFRWADSISRCIPTGRSFDLRARSICNYLHLPSRPFPEFPVVWQPWSAYGYGMSCNVGVYVLDDAALMSAIFRDQNGVFRFAIRRAGGNRPFLKCLLYILSDVRGLGICFDRLQVSHDDIHLLARNAEVERALYPIKTKMVRDLAGIGVFHVCPSMNRPANALCFSKVGLLTSGSFEELPIAVRRALDQDVSPQPCSFLDQRIFM